MKRTTIFLLTILGVQIAFGQEIIQHFYGDYFLDETGTSLAATPDGGFVLAGEIERDSTRTDVFVFKTDSIGRIDWKIISSDLEDYYCTSVISTQDGGFLVSGYVLGFIDIGTFRNLFFWKIDTDGNIEWKKIIDDGYNSGIVKTVELPDGDFVSIFVGALSTGERRPGIIKINSGGSFMWKKQFGESVYSKFEDVILCKDGNLMIIGLWRSPSSLSKDSWFLKIDTDGQTLFEKIIDREHRIDYLYSTISESEGGSFIAAGRLKQENIILDSICLHKTSNDGSTVWEKVISSGDRHYYYPQIKSFDQDSFLIAALVRIENEETNYPRAVRLISINGDGQILNTEKHQEGSISDYIFDLEVLPYGGYAAIGSGTRPNGASQDFYLLIKPPVFPDTSIVDNVEELVVAPNPSPGKLTIGYKSELTGKIDIEFFNSAGQIIYHAVEEKTAFLFQKNYAFQDWPTGIFFIRLTDNGHVSTSSWVKN